jgi:hypothetical protein
VSSKYKVKTTLFKLRHLKGSYSEENIVKVIITIIKIYEITNKIDYFILNNVRLNDTYISVIIKSLNIKNIKEYYRLHYLNYILNLLVKAILFSHDPDIFEKDITTIIIFEDKYYYYYYYYY